MAPWHTSLTPNLNCYSPPPMATLINLLRDTRRLIELTRGSPPEKKIRNASPTELTSIVQSDTKPSAGPCSAADACHIGIPARNSRKHRSSHSTPLLLLLGHE